jgi:hypothetical protein
LAPLFLVVAAAGVASAAVHVRIAVSPTTIAQCSEGHGILVVGNDGTSPILARVCFALTRSDTTLLGPVCARVPLAAGERRSHEFTFFVPARARPGDYAFVVRAAGSDGSSDVSAAPFTIVLSATPCVPPSSSISDPNSDMLNGVMQGTGMAPDQPTPTRQTTWGRIKTIYR